MNKREDSPIINQVPGLNPFLPFDTYIPDGEPKVFEGRVFLYGSFDIFNGGYCSREYHAYSAPVGDLTQWTDHGVSFTSDEVPWSDEMLYAPDALFHGGKYYLYFCLSDGSEGVAESDRPEGPFKNAKRITLDGEPISGIDPSVLEDNGRIYYTWGQFHLMMGELNDDMCSLKTGSIHSSVISNDEGCEGFHEGSSLRKIGDKYCLIYASEYTPEYPNKGGRPTKLDYAVADSPFGPYERRGTVTDNYGCDPESWNNHGSVIKIGGEWYVFCHASSNNTRFSRRARAERLEVNEKDCIITQAVPSTNGFVKELLPEHIKSPVNACGFFGGAYVTQTADGRFPAVNLKNDSGFGFSPVSFEAGEYVLNLEISAIAEAEIIISLGDKTSGSAKIKKCESPDADEYFSLPIPFKAETGAYALGIKIRSRCSDPVCKINRLSIERAAKSE